MKADTTVLRLSLKVAALIVATVGVAAAVFLIATQQMQKTAVERKVLAEARTLNTEMEAVWDYIDVSQPTINYDSGGHYDFKGIYCSVAGKSIARRFTNDAEGYVIRYVREDPRTAGDEPDDFELVALSLFRSGVQTEYYGVESVDGVSYFRYLSALKAKNGCLNCHGEPAGAKDEVGFVKEGMALGDLAGAVSIMIPLDSYEFEARADAQFYLLFFMCLAVAMALLLALLMRRLVGRPLERANERLKDESEAKSNFLAVMSHELRTPLSSIIAYADLIERSRVLVGTQHEESLREIEKNSRSLLGMVNNTIDVAKIEAGRLEFHYDEVDVVDLVNDVMATASPLAKEKEVRLVKEVDPRIPIVRSDWEALRKVLTNLVGNAVKFAPEGGSVKVSAVLGEGGGTVVLAVEDDGEGISRDDMSRIFERFTQVTSDGGKRASGSGLGLYLSKTLVKGLGGTLSAESAVGVGSRFTAIVPVADGLSGPGGDGDLTDNGR